MFKIKKHFSESKTELDKVIFPTNNQIKSSFLNVIFMVSFISVFLFFIDVIVTSLITQTI